MEWIWIEIRLLEWIAPTNLGKPERTTVMELRVALDSTRVSLSPLATRAFMKLFPLSTVSSIPVQQTRMFEARVKGIWRSLTPPPSATME
jgi:hypothetical protein